MNGKPKTAWLLITHPVAERVFFFSIGFDAFLHCAIYVCINANKMNKL